MILTILFIALMADLQPPPVQHQWVPLVVTSSERIEIDTASIQVLDSKVRRVWLRWNLNIARPTFEPGHQPLYDLELRDLDCATNRTRTIQKRSEAPTGGAGAGESLSASEASWQQPSNGSLLAQVLDAACRLTKAGA